MDRKENLHRLSIELLQGQLNILIQIYGQVVDYFEFLDSFYFEFQQIFCQKIGRSNTLDSGINVAPGITIAPLLKIMILLLFYIHLGIVVIFYFYFLQNFSKINNNIY